MAPFTGCMVKNFQLIISLQYHEKCNPQIFGYRPSAAEGAHIVMAGSAKQSQTFCTVLPHDKFHEFHEFLKKQVMLLFTSLYLDNAVVNGEVFQSVTTQSLLGGDHGSAIKIVIKYVAKLPDEQVEAECQHAMFKYFPLPFCPGLRYLDWRHLRAVFCGNTHPYINSYC